MKAFLVLFLALALCLVCASDAYTKPVIKAYFNGQEATVTGVKLKVGEPFTVDLYVTPDRYTTVAALFREPGGDGDDAYALVSGDPRGVVVHKKGGPNDTVHFRWVLAPTEAWTGGTAPLNIQYDVWGETMAGDVQGYFTVVEAYISPEHYEPPSQASTSYLPAAAALAVAARHRLPRITKPLYRKPLLLPSHVRKVIQGVKNEKDVRDKRLV